MSFPSLKSRSDFETFQRERSRVPRLDGRFLRLVRLPDADRCLFGFKIGRNTGKAVRRNRIRRILRGALMGYLDTDSQKRGQSFPKGLYLIIVKQNIRDISDRGLSHEIQRDLSMIIERLKS